MLRVNELRLGGHVAGVLHGSGRVEDVHLQQRGDSAEEGRTNLPQPAPAPPGSMGTAQVGTEKLLVPPTQGCPLLY